MPKRADKFLVTTILLDILLLSISDVFIPPLDFRLYGVLAIFLVSPLCAYLLVYRLFT